MWNDWMPTEPRKNDCSTAPRLSECVFAGQSDRLRNHPRWPHAARWYRMRESLPPIKRLECHRLFERQETGSRKPKSKSRPRELSPRSATITVPILR